MKETSLHTGMLRSCNRMKLIIINGWASKDFVMQRAEDRGWREGGLLTPEKCEDFWEKMDVTDLDEQGVLEAIQKILK